MTELFLFQRISHYNIHTIFTNILDFSKNCAKLMTYKK